MTSKKERARAREREREKQDDDGEEREAFAPSSYAIGLSFLSGNFSRNSFSTFSRPF